MPMYCTAEQVSDVHKGSPKNMPFLNTKTNAEGGGAKTTEKLQLLYNGITRIAVRCTAEN